MIEIIDNQEVIREFQGEHRFLSNFWGVPVHCGDFLFPTAEHAYQAFKCEDHDEFQQIRQCRSPGEAKRLGRRVSIRGDWDRIRLRTMRDIVTAKFTQNDDMMERLLDTGEALLIEGNYWHDQFWGSCLCPKHKHTPGENHLGKILMDIRREHLARRKKD